MWHPARERNIVTAHRLERNHNSPHKVLILVICDIKNGHELHVQQ